jgi:transketolase
MRPFKLHNSVAELKIIAKEMRIGILKMLNRAGSGHTGGSLSCVELVSALYFSELRHDPRNPDWEDRDRFIISKGHACPTVYTALAFAGYFPLQELDTLRKLNSILQGHPYSRATPGIEVSTGSLGHGLAMANGIALAGRLDGRDYHVFCLLGDGESQEGEVWEASMAAAHYGLDHVCAILDHNGLQIDGPNDEVMKVMPVVEKWRAFGWHTIQIDGHDFDQIIAAYRAARQTVGRPTMIVAETVKGRGISFMENVVDFHGLAPTDEQLARALEELESKEP